MLGARIAGCRRTSTSVLAGHTREVSALAALSDSELASAAADGTMRVWNTRDAGRGAGGVPVQPPLVVQVEPITAVDALVPLPGGRLATSSERVRLWQLPARR